MRNNLILFSGHSVTFMLQTIFATFLSSRPSRQNNSLDNTHITPHMLTSHSDKRRPSIAELLISLINVADWAMIVKVFKLVDAAKQNWKLSNEICSGLIDARLSPTFTFPCRH